MVDLAAVRVDPAGIHAELRLAQVADDRVDAALAAPALDQLVEALARPLAHEHMDVTAPLQQTLDEIAPDEAGGSRDEVGAAVSLSHGGQPIRAAP